MRLSGIEVEMTDKLPESLRYFCLPVAGEWCLFLRGSTPYPTAFRFAEEAAEAIDSGALIILRKKGSNRANVYREGEGTKAG